MISGWYQDVALIWDTKILFPHCFTSIYLIHANYILWYWVLFSWLPSKRIRDANINFTLQLMNMSSGRTYCWVPVSFCVWVWAFLLTLKTCFSRLLKSAQHSSAWVCSFFRDIWITSATRVSSISEFTHLTNLWGILCDI